MNIDYLTQLLQNKLNILNGARIQAFTMGDLEQINKIDAEALEIQNTLLKLGLLSGISVTAQATGKTEAEIVSTGIEETFNPSVIDDATRVLLSFDITPYATDPYHEIKIQNILEKMGKMDTVEQIETYIKKANPDSPLNGTMVFSACEKYKVDARLALALMELDSRFGTVGVGARTFNPGNIGNTGQKEREYATWEDGVNAVANWLDHNRRVDPTAVAAPVVIPPVATTTPVFTESVSKETATSSSPVGTTTPEVVIPTEQATSTTATPTATTTSETATTTEINIPVTDTATTTATTTETTTEPAASSTPSVEVPKEEATSTPEVEITATSTQARVSSKKKARV